MLVASCHWQRHIGDFIMVTESLCLQLFFIMLVFSVYKSVTSQSCYQHISSPTSVAKMDVAIDIAKNLANQITLLERANERASFFLKIFSKL